MGKTKLVNFKLNHYPLETPDKNAFPLPATADYPSSPLRERN